MAPHPSTSVRRLARILVNFDATGPNLTDYGPNLANDGRIRPKFGRCLFDLGRHRQESARFRLKSTRNRPIWAISTGPSPTWAKLGMSSENMHGPRSGTPIDQRGVVDTRCHELTTAITDLTPVALSPRSKVCEKTYSERWTPLHTAPRHCPPEATTAPPTAQRGRPRERKRKRRGTPHISRSLMTSHKTKNICKLGRHSP